MILLEESWSELFLLNAIQWCMPLDPSTSPLFSVSEHMSAALGGTKSSQIACEVRTLADTLNRFKAVLVDPAEFACLKAIVLFRAGKCYRVRPSLHFPVYKIWFEFQFFSYFSRNSRIKRSKPNRKFTRSSPSDVTSTL